MAHVNPIWLEERLNRIERQNNALLKMHISMFQSIMKAILITAGTSKNDANSLSIHAHNEAIDAYNNEIG